MERRARDALSILPRAWLRRVLLPDNPIDSVEHRRWPPLGTTELDSWGVDAIEEICNHFSEIECMAGFDVEEALHQWSRLKRELSGQPFFVLPFRNLGACFGSLQHSVSLLHSAHYHSNHHANSHGHFVL